ncbi:hypothetical protein ACHAXR_008269 [Thalassiosira sp. AJA248-18]
MTSSSFFFLVAVVAIALVSPLINAFSPSHTSSSSSVRHPTTPLSMGIFDSIGKAFSNEEYGAPPDAVKATARHILVPSLDDANQVLEEIGRGETSFAALAGKYSTCPSKSSGGSLGSFGPGTMVKEFDEVVFNPETKMGEIKGPIQTQFGYHLLVVDKRTGGGDWY